MHPVLEGLSWLGDGLPSPGLWSVEPDPRTGSPNYLSGWTLKQEGDPPGQKSKNGDAGYKAGLV